MKKNNTLKKESRVKLNKDSLTIKFKPKEYLATKSALEYIFNSMDETAIQTTVQEDPATALHYITLRNLYTKRFSSSILKEKVNMPYTEAIALYMMIRTTPIDIGLITSHMYYFFELDQQFTRSLHQFLK